jgi:hypothetical protein
MDFEIFNMLGETVYKGSVIEKTIIPTDSFKPGLYIIKVANDSSFEYKKVMKK